MLQVLNLAEGLNFFANRAFALDDAMRQVEPILKQVKAEGDEALFAFAKKFDGFDESSFLISSDELLDAKCDLDTETRSVLEFAASNIERFARMQKPSEFMKEVEPGIHLGQIVRPLESIGVYVPGGRYPMPSTVLMSVIPARVAGVEEIWVTTPNPHATILGAAGLVGANACTVLGGAYAIAAYAYGTETVPKVDRIVGPGNIYVSAAKKLLAGEVSIDFIAGPTEVCLYANSGNPEWIAADLIAQSEHDTSACAVFITTSNDLAKKVQEATSRQLLTLPTAPVARQALQYNGRIILVPNRESAYAAIQAMAPEHLCLWDDVDFDAVAHAGSVFIGAFSSEALGDYVVGPNHTLPTLGGSRAHSGLSVYNFLKIIPVQKVDAGAAVRLGIPGARFARLEGLEAHARSIEMRLEDRNES